MVSSENLYIEHCRPDSNVTGIWIFLMDFKEKIRKFTEARNAIGKGFYPYFTEIDESSGTEVMIKGKKVIMAGSNNYLGLTHHPKVRKAAQDAIRIYGTSCTGSRFLNGTLKIHIQLEEKIAHFLGKEDAICFSTGFQTNIGVIDAIAGKKDIILVDRDCHASIYDGARISMCELLRFKHNDVEDLEQKIASSDDARLKLLAVDGVFSMEGDIARLDEIAKISSRSKNTLLLLDDAHSIGVLGNGRGTEAHFKITDAVDITTGTFSKSLASLGGFVAGRRDLIHYIKHHARPLIFSASITPANAAAALASLEIIESEPERIKKLHLNSEMIRSAFNSIGLDTGNSCTPIIPVIVGNRMKTVQMAAFLLENGIFVNAVIEPAVPKGRDLLRTSCMSTHSEKQIACIIETFKKAGKKFGLI